MSSDQLSKAVAQVSAWIDSVVVSLNICPFAKRELDAGRVRVCAPDVAVMEAALEAIADEAIKLLHNDVTATTLVVLAQGFEEFDDYLDLLDMSEALLEECGWSESLQLASFHPDYCFDGVEQDDAANYTNRSPLPIIHLLRQDDVAKAIAGHPDVDSIPDSNQAMARSKGGAFFDELLRRCKQA